MKIIKNIFIAFALLILTMSVLVVVFISFNPIKTFQILKVMSGSMEPALHTGSIAFVKQTNPLNLKEGDIVSYSIKNSSLVTHRIVKVNTNGQELNFITKGDANKVADVDAINSTDIKGKVIFSIPFLGYLSNWTRTPVGFILLIIIPAVLIILNEIFSMHKAVKDEIKKKVNENKKPLLLSFFIITGAVFLFTINPTLAFFSDGEVVTNNTFSTGNWISPTPNPSILPISGSPTPVPVSPSLSPTPISTPSLVINEVSSDGVFALEWVEIYNPTASSVDISGWKIEDGNSDDTIQSVSPIPAGGYAVIRGNTSSVVVPNTAILITMLEASIGSGLNDAGDLVRLKNSSDITVDEMSYGINVSIFPTPPSEPDTGESLSRSPNGVDTNTASDWVIDTTPSVGLAN